MSHVCKLDQKNCAHGTNVVNISRAHAISNLQWEGTQWSGDIVNISGGRPHIMRCCTILCICLMLGCVSHQQPQTYSAHHPFSSLGGGPQPASEEDSSQHLSEGGGKVLRRLMRHHGNHDFGSDNHGDVMDRGVSEGEGHQKQRERRESGPSGDHSPSHSNGGRIDTADLDADDLVHELFEKYGHDGYMTIDGFEQLLHSIGLLDKVHERPEGEHEHKGSHSNSSSSTDADLGTDERERRSRPNQDQCLDLASIWKAGGAFQQTIDQGSFRDICPVLINQLDKPICNYHRHNHGEVDRNVLVNDGNSTVEHPQQAAIWGFSMLSCILISVLSLAGLPLIPAINKIFYNHLLQFLVALAIGTLAGDALLHLLPHAMVPHHSNSNSGDHDHENSDLDHHDDGSNSHVVWLGLTALGGMYLFFLVESTMGVLVQWINLKRAHKQEKKEEMDTENGAMMEKQGSPRNSVHVNNLTSCQDTMMVVHPSKGIRDIAVQAQVEAQNECDLPQPEGRLLHTHSHSSQGHQAGQSISSVAWMVIMGDGIHNFTDGLAIGAAFAQSMSSGLSTSVAVFCHELPHELGDFAVLLSVGMSMKKALFYNLISALLALLGNAVGVAIGSTTSATPWILCLIAGMFLYVALVDMLPELTKITSKAGESALFHLVLQNLGILVGASIMLVIALYEGSITFPVA